MIGYCEPLDAQTTSCEAHGMHNLTIPLSQRNPPVALNKAYSSLQNLPIMVIMLH
jgi:hypothetical protein